jgi:hypothetical protein
VQTKAPHLVIHRVNTVARLREVPTRYGAEIDVRADGSRLYLHHDPFVPGESLIDLLDAYRHGLLVLNIKEAGIESETLRLVRERGIAECFLLDVEFPYLYRASRQGERRIAVRYSEDEPIDLVERYRDRVDWVWIDTNTRLPLDAEIIETLRGLKTCLVCPERWGRPRDILAYRRAMAKLGFTPDAVMTALACVPDWERPL